MISQPQHPVLYDETVPDILIIAPPNKPMSSSWDPKLLKTVFILIPEFKALMIRVEGDITVEQVMYLLLQKYKLAFVNPVISVENRGLSTEQIHR